MSPIFTMPDASGLTPLVLPESFLGGGDSSLPQPSSDAVRRFEAAMGAVGGMVSDGSRMQSGITQMLDAQIGQENDPVEATEYPPGHVTEEAVDGADEAAILGQEGSRTIGEEGKRIEGQEGQRTEDQGQATNVWQTPNVKPSTLTPQRLTLDARPVPLDSRPASINPQSAPLASQPSDDTEVVLQAAPVQVAASEVQSAAVVPGDGGLSVSAVSARTEAIVDTINEVVEAVVGQMTVTPSLVQGEGEVRMTLKPTVLDGSDITLSAKDGTLTVAVTPATLSAEQAVAAAMPRLEIALAEHAPAFRHVEVALVAKKGKTDEVA